MARTQHIRASSVLSWIAKFSIMRVLALVAVFAVVNIVRVATAQVPKRDKRATFNSELITGEYNEGNGFLGIDLNLTLDGKFTYKTWCHRLGEDYPETFGTYRLSGREITLLADHPLELVIQKWDPVPERLVALMWGEKVYLEPATNEGLLHFCNLVNGGFKRRWAMYRWPFHRSSDEDKPTTRTPDVPDSWRAYLLPNPVSCTIIEKGDNNTATIDAGRSSGLKVGMALYGRKHDSFGDPVQYEVLSVDEKVSKVRGERDLAPEWEEKLSSTY